MSTTHRWVALPELPGHEGTIGGRLRRVSTGIERMPTGPSGIYPVRLPDGRRSSVTPASVGRAAARALGVPPLAAFARLPAGRTGRPRQFA